MDRTDSQTIIIQGKNCPSDQRNILRSMASESSQQNHKRNEKKNSLEYFKNDVIQEQLYGYNFQDRYSGALEELNIEEVGKKIPEWIKNINFLTKNYPEFISNLALFLKYYQQHNLVEMDCLGKKIYKTYTNLEKTQYGSLHFVVGNFPMYDLMKCSQQIHIQVVLRLLYIRDTMTALEKGFIEKFSEIQFSFQHQGSIFNKDERKEILAELEKSHTRVYIFGGSFKSRFSRMFEQLSPEQMPRRYAEAIQGVKSLIKQHPSFIENLIQYHSMIRGPSNAAEARLEKAIYEEYRDLNTAQVGFFLKVVGNIPWPEWKFESQVYKEVVFRLLYVVIKILNLSQDLSDGLFPPVPQDREQKTGYLDSTYPEPDDMTEWPNEEDVIYPL